MSELCRRTVLKGAALTCGAGLLTACGGNAGDRSAAPAAPAPGRSAPPGGGGLRASLATLSDVPVGGAAEATAPDGSKVLVTQPSAGEVAAFRAVCPHEGCSVLPDAGQLTCPCHGSQFSLSGEVTRGPAQSDLEPFAVRVMDGQVLPA
jgi:cytochrome b6-f complex iron-sulfur subunit